ncbi:hypothetical protein HDV00_002782 [Rhizophlyctis rosea]|nr:hypothetical protein HDV00_002782 [Rhizophlyctis rosea]
MPDEAYVEVADLIATPSATPPENSLGPTLAKIDDDALISILRYVPLNCMSALLSTCRKLRSILRDPQIIVVLLKSEAPYIALANLRRFPFLGRKAEVIDKLLHGPIPPLYYLEKFLVKAKTVDALRFAWADIKLRQKWYSPALVEMPAPAVRPPRLSYNWPRRRPIPPSCLSMVRFCQNHNNPDKLKGMLDDELFPLAEFFKERAKESYSNDRDFLSNPIIKERITLLDVLPGLERNASDSVCVAVLNSLYDSAPSSLQGTFDRQILHLLDVWRSGKAWDISNNLFTGFTDHITKSLSTDPSKKTHPHIRLRLAVRQSDIAEIHNQITANDQRLDAVYLWYEVEHLYGRQDDIRGFCVAAGLLQSGKTGCQYRMYVEAMVRKLMEQVAFIQGSPAEQVYRRGCLEFLVNEMAVGTVNWRPTRNTLLGFKERLERENRRIWGYDEGRKVRMRELVDWMDDVFTQARKGLKEKKKELGVADVDVDEKEKEEVVIRRSKRGRLIDEVQDDEGGKIKGATRKLKRSKVIEGPEAVEGGNSAVAIRRSKRVKK